MHNNMRDDNGKLITKRATLSKKLDENIEMFKEIFKNDNTFRFRYIQSNVYSDLRCAIIFFDGMVNNGAINESIVEPIQLYNPKVSIRKDSKLVLEQIIEINEAKVDNNLSTILDSVLFGDTLILIDGDNSGVIANTKGFSTRGISEPDNEKVLRGPKEGFNENLMTNLSLIRRKIRNPNLKFSFLKLGSNTNTNASLCYIDGLADEKVLSELKKRIETYELDSAMDINYLIENIKDSKASLFPTVGTTERPDIVAAKILEGRVALILDGSPVAMTAPYVFLENFQSNDDYYINYFYANMGRVLRIIGFFLTISLPAIYLALLTFHMEIVPTNLLINIARAKTGIPFPMLVEAVVLLVIFEVLKEAGTRTPASIGQALSIVGGLVLGQTAVEARFVSAPMVIVVAFAGITALTVPKLKTSAVYFRLGLLILASMFGLYGYILGIGVLIVHLCAIESFGIPYLTDITSAKVGNYKDVYLRFPWFAMKKNHRFLAGDRGNIK